MSFKKLLLIILTICTFQASKSDVIFFDLVDTLVYVKKFQILNYIGKMNVFKHFCNTFNWRHPLTFKEYMQQRYFEGLAAINYQSKVAYECYSDDGITPLPPLLKDFMVGAITSNQAKQICQKWSQNKNNTFFKTDIEREIFEKTFDSTFNPNYFVGFLSSLDSTISVLKKCKQEVDTRGNKRHICIVLSNFAQECVEPFKQKFNTEIAPYIDCWIFSCDGHGAKPSSSIYDYCYDIICNKFPQQKNKQRFFIDDQKVNRDAAEKIKHPFICAHPNQAAFMLHQYGVIS